jgi:lia operon protein LiaF
MLSYTSRRAEMRNQVLTFVGATILLVGLISLIGAIFDVDTGRLVCPILVILLGVGLLLRPRMLPASTTFDAKLLGDVRRRGAWQVADEELWVLVGDVRLDLTEAEVPAGETTIRLFGIVGDVVVIVPQDVGISISSTCVATEARIFDQRYNRVFAPFTFISDGYDSAERKLHLEVFRIVASIKVRQASQQEPA